MSTYRKALERLQTNPPVSNLKWLELKGILEHFGYKMRTKSGGSRRKFYHEKTGAIICCHQPHPSPNVDKGCIVDVVEHLKSYGFI